jgi:hypothetical protein
MTESSVRGDRGERLVSVERARPDRSIVDATVSRHDLLLLTLPMPLFAAAVAGVLTTTPLHLSVGAGSLPSALLVVYGLFVDAPAAPATGATRVPPGDANGPTPGSDPGSDPDA